eukprot:TRINITY_DN22201_c0_g1_i1.p7 TRINITY_DN22201_c0_g1~~TRINITY_DN22201_c0_g1_i1.p7  ORF type:complete len:108 (+),score=0.17 TRINITY_DN22201_c0_g1_i1:446-769(+)
MHIIQQHGYQIFGNLKQIIQILSIQLFIGIPIVEMPILAYLEAQNLRGKEFTMLKQLMGKINLIALLIFGNLKQRTQKMSRQMLVKIKCVKYYQEEQFVSMCTYIFT